MSKMKIKKGDTVRVIAGKDKGAEGKVLVVDHKNERVIVEGVNLVTKHLRSNGLTQAGIVHKEAPIHVSNVVYLHEGRPTRIGIKTETQTVKGKEVTVRKRFAKKTGEVID